MKHNAKHNAKRPDQWSDRFQQFLDSGWLSSRHQNL